jgi:protein-L-isoaspartate(D-aspartate) O-methyltransferase
MHWRRTALFFAFSILSILAGCVRAEGPPETQAVPIASEEDPFQVERNRLIESGIIAMGITSDDVIDAMRSVERHRFVPEEYLSLAYENHPLPIGYGQTISQPYIVALMTEALDVEAGDRVLEVGTGSGYQAAILAEMGAEVFTIEIIEPLAVSAENRLRSLGYADIHTLQGDGYFGWEENAPYDAIIVTAAPDHVPQPLLKQLVEGGVLIIPVGPVGGYQELWKVTRLEGARYQPESLGGVRFVPLTRQAGN